MSTSMPPSSVKLAEKTGGHDLTQHLRERTDDELLSLFRVRPDLATPLPGDFPALAGRASSPSSLSRALHQLTLFELEILDIARCSHSRVEVAKNVDTPIDQAWDRLTTLGLIWEQDGAICVNNGLTEVNGPPQTPDTIHPAPPTAHRTEPAGVDPAGAAAALELLRGVKSVLDYCAEHSPQNMRSGGLALKDQRQLAQALGHTEAHTALLLDLAHSAALLETTAERPGEWLPTVQFDLWNASPPPQQWHRLAATWLHAPRLPHLAGARDENDRRIAALSPELTRSSAPTLRAKVFDVLSQQPTGHALAPTDVVALLDWRWARAASKTRTQAILAILTEAELLGMTGRGAITTYARLLCQNKTQAAVDGLASILPPPIDHVLVQADLTVIAPGPLIPELAAEISLVADQESSGGALVYRISAESIARALRGGKTANDLHRLFTSHSRTPIPQSLTYLIDDVARRHGGLRLGAVGSYLRSDDTALLAALVADRTLTPLQLRLLAPTVAVTPLAAHRISTVITDAGYPLALEDTTGTLVVAPREERRTSTREHWRPSAPAQLDEQAVRAALPLLRRADTAAHSTQTPPPAAQTMEQILATLTAAVGTKELIEIGYLDPHGEIRTRVVQVTSVGGGYLRAQDPRAENAHTFQLHRLASARSHSG